MQLNVPTLIVAGVYVLLLVALLMFLAWRSGRREPTLGYLSLTLFLGVVATVLGALRSMSDTLRFDYNLERLMGEADRALYEAKAAGRNCVRVAG
ncbi:hypothetical protein [Stutzerimonas nitrititolerans]|uniref:hypothetical protein n=1 Tax=Stutzerimonas nitrititolerans TaxID=2482751 RepID=UPI002898EAFC|nr:hypothetical protein [Stutzerimonas nitrititolerans]